MAAPKGRAVTPAEKRAIAERILAAWLKCPELRLGQLLENAIGSGMLGDVFYAEDERFAAGFERYAEHVVASRKGGG